MDSTADAQGLTREIADILAPNRGWKAQINSVHRALISERRRIRLPELKWSCVKSWFYGEARRVDYYEMLALKDLRAEKELDRAKRRIAADARILAAHHSEAGTPLDSDVIIALGSLARLADLPRDGGSA